MFSFVLFFFKSKYSDLFKIQNELSVNINLFVFSPRLLKLKEWIDKNDPGALIIPFCGTFEHKLVEMEDAERAAYLKEQGTTRYALFS